MIDAKKIEQIAEQITNVIPPGVKNMAEDGEIIISAFELDGSILISIEDNGYKPVDYEAISKLLNDEEPNHLSGYGIRNINQRIHLHFGTQYGISYDERVEGGTIVIVKLPKSEILE